MFGVKAYFGDAMRPDLLHAAGIAIGVLGRWPAGRIAMRVVGVGIAVGGAVFLLRALS